MSPSDCIHIVEPGGRGGVYQHVLGSVQKEKYGEFSRVVIHTARDAEITPDLPRAEYCSCMRWQRSGPRTWRTLLTLAWSLAYLLPHLILASRRSRIEVQGQFGGGLFALIILGAKATRTPVTFAPHNSFARDGSRLSHGALNMAIETADTLRLYNSRDFPFIPANRIVRDELSMYIPECSVSDTLFWEEKIRKKDRLVIGFVGQLRKDKNPALLAAAVRMSGVAATLVYAGEDKGAVEDLSNVELGSNQDMVVIEEYLSLPKLVALVRLVDVIVCPYSVSSQSGVAALARELDKPVIASDVGGLGEQAEMVFEISSEPEQELAKAIATFAVRSGERRNA
ncbi:glycosyltransferase [Rhodococcus koreensis]|uniref:glycosyltransferase n=1 Tax=Rhodococcus koreensis TaxID=99653 RepID=UPI00197DD6DC|nr:glycosyltransferase [Rhodococcus koreensis]QSE87083.1 glycosyltransferase [Rhodococcus koreensis]